MNFADGSVAGEDAPGGADLPARSPASGAPPTSPPDPSAPPALDQNRGLALPGQARRPGLQFEETDDDTLRKIVRGQLLNLSLNARDEDVRFKATKELADELGLVEDATARVKVKHGLAGPGSSGPASQNLIIADERVAAHLIGGLRGLLGAAKGPSDAQ